MVGLEKEAEGKEKAELGGDEEVGNGERGTKKERRGGERDDGRGRVEAWQAVQRDVPLETENSPVPD